MLPAVRTGSISKANAPLVARHLLVSVYALRRLERLATTAGLLLATLQVLAQGLGQSSVLLGGAFRLSLKGRFPDTLLVVAPSGRHCVSTHCTANRAAQTASLDHSGRHGNRDRATGPGEP